MSCSTKIEVCDTGVEALYCGALQRPAPYYARVLNPIDNGKGYWNSLRVGIFQRPEADIKSEGYTEPKIMASDVQIGEYVRKYSTLFRTFHPFQLRGKWYALYSADYTCTRIMELPSCKDIGGEKGDSFGFCPVDFWVPPLSDLQTMHDESCPRNAKVRKPDYTVPCKCGDDILHTEACQWRASGGKETCNCDRNERYYAKYHKWVFPERVHGFVAGCIWGDDSSWKIEYLDLSRADEGIIKREAKFGYISMPAELNLDQAIDLDVDENHISIKIASEDYYDFATGEKQGD